jgi:hypothetical protein
MSEPHPLAPILERIAVALEAIAAKPASTFSRGASKSAPTKRTPPGEFTGWRAFKIPFGKAEGQTLGELHESNRLQWWIDNYQPKPFRGSVSEKDQRLRDWLDEAHRELGGKPAESTRDERPAQQPKDKSIDEQDVPF